MEVIPHLAVPANNLTQSLMVARLSPKRSFFCGLRLKREHYGTQLIVYTEVVHYTWIAIILQLAVAMSDSQLSFYFPFTLPFHIHSYCISYVWVKWVHSVQVMVYILVSRCLGEGC